jgi:hypothetical protein
VAHPRSSRRARRPVGITEVIGPDEWPFSSHVYVVTTASPEDVTEWAVELDPDPPVDWWTTFLPSPYRSAPTS